MTPDDVVPVITFLIGVSLLPVFVSFLWSSTLSLVRS